VHPEGVGDVGKGGLMQDRAIVENDRRQARRIYLVIVQQLLALVRIGVIEDERNRISGNRVTQGMALWRPALPDNAKDHMA
jgi:hypothetical protein